MLKCCYFHKYTKIGILPSNSLSGELHEEGHGGNNKKIEHSQFVHLLSDVSFPALPIKHRWNRTVPEKRLSFGTQGVWCISLVMLCLRSNFMPHEGDLPRNITQSTRGAHKQSLAPVSSEISDFTPCAHAQSNILHTKYTLRKLMFR